MARSSAKPMTPFGLWLTAQLQSKDLTLTEVADRMGLPLTTVARWRYSFLPNLENAALLAKALGMEVSDVTGAAGLDDRHSHPDPIRAEVHQLVNMIDTPYLVALLPMLRGIQSQSRSSRAESIARFRQSLEPHD